MDLKSLFPALGGSVMSPVGGLMTEQELLRVFGLLRRPQYRTATPLRSSRAIHPARYAVHERGTLSKAFRNYAVRYMTKDAIRAKRRELEQEAIIAARSDNTPLAQRLSSRSATYPW